MAVRVFNIVPQYCPVNQTGCVQYLARVETNLGSGCRVDNVTYLANSWRSCVLEPRGGQGMN